MDKLTRYIFNYYPHLMTLHEQAAYRSVLGEEKAESSDSAKMRNLLRRKFVSPDPEVLSMLDKGAEHFMNVVRDRILSEQRDQVFQNHCPKCEALAHTPTARQCPKCFHSWHDDK